VAKAEAATADAKNTASNAENKALSAKIRKGQSVKDKTPANKATAKDAAETAESIKNASKPIVKDPPNAVKDVAFKVLPKAKCELKEGKDYGAAARCKSTECAGKEGVAPGKMDCRPSSISCLTASGWVDGNHDPSAEEKCQAQFGNPIECPDGIGPRGVFIPSNDGGYCASWDSPAAARTFTECTEDKQTCGTLSAKKPHGSSRSSGLLMLKRMTCKDGECKVYKTGQCFDVSPATPFQSIYTDKNNYDVAQLEQDTQAFAALAVKQMLNSESGELKACNGHDLALSESIIKVS